MSLGLNLVDPDLKLILYTALDKDQLKTTMPENFGKIVKVCHPLTAKNNMLLSVNVFRYNLLDFSKMGALCRVADCKTTTKLLFRLFSILLQGETEKLLNSGAET